MASTYHIGQHRKHRARKAVIIFVASILIIGVIGGFIGWDLLRSQETGGGSTERTVSQEVQGQTTKDVVVDESLFRLQLPEGWKEVDRQQKPTEHSITWQATEKGADNRWLKIYIDTIPSSLPVNRLLPVEVQNDNSVTFGQISDNCINFTGPGRADLETKNPGPTRSKWQQVDFICDLTNYLQNKVGTSAPGSINSFEIKSPTHGTHRYFFLYTDHNIQPRYSILYDAIGSFEAK